ncbi:MAG: MGH1-like glycoside hydrolase domain-containing protein [Actinomycetota bacterium]
MTQRHWIGNLDAVPDKQTDRPISAERHRLLEADAGSAGWRQWGPYLAERAWGTVREDYSPGGDAWEFFPHDHARSRAYRWNEDGLAGICDEAQRFCLAFAFWNGVDPILKERIFGLTNAQGNHGEDAKEYWWYLDSTPTHSWMRWRYVYPQGEFPYDLLVEENARRKRNESEFELVDTDVFADGFWVVTIDFAKAGPTDMMLRVRVDNRGSAATLHVLPTLWFRNTWAWSSNGGPRPHITTDGSTLRARHPALGTLTPVGGGDPRALACDNDENAERLWGGEPRIRYPKDGIGDHVVHGADTVNPAGEGTKAALHYELTIPGGGTAEVRLRLAQRESAFDLSGEFDRVMREREREADEFYAEVTPPSTDTLDARSLRRAFAELLWSKQFYYYDVKRWLDGDESRPPPPPARRNGRNADWTHLLAHDVLVVPDGWEYPWYSAFEHAFAAVALAYVDAEFAKDQLLTVCGETFMHHRGQIPAYEWDFGDVPAPMQAWAVLRVFEIDGGRDLVFLARAFNKLMLNLTWWANLASIDGKTIFEGGDIGAVLSGSGGLVDPAISTLEGVADAVVWVATHCLNLLEISFILARRDPVYEDLAMMLFSAFCKLASIVDESGRWHEKEGTFMSLLRTRKGMEVAVGGSLDGLVPSWAVAPMDASIGRELPQFSRRLRAFRARNEGLFELVADEDAAQRTGRVLVRLVQPARLRRILRSMLSPAEFLSPSGLRSLSARYREQPFELELEGQVWRLGYEPGEAQTALFGGNSNFRGPVWPTFNFLVIDALRRYHAYVGDGFTVEHPPDSGQQQTLHQVADDLARRVISLFQRNGAATSKLGVAALPDDVFSSESDLTMFDEYFHGDTGGGLGASHSTGSAAVAALLIVQRRPH